MKLHYYPETDSLYIELSRVPARHAAPQAHRRRTAYEGREEIRRRLVTKDTKALRCPAPRCVARFLPARAGRLWR